MPFCPVAAFVFTGRLAFSSVATSVAGSAGAAITSLPLSSPRVDATCIHARYRLAVQPATALSKRNSADSLSGSLERAANEECLRSCRVASRQQLAALWDTRLLTLSRWTAPRSTPAFAPPAKQHAGCPRHPIDAIDATHASQGKAPQH